MSYQTSKTMGDIWLSLIYETDEHRKIEGFAALAALAYAAACAKKANYEETAPELEELKKDIQTLEKIAQMSNISDNRDMSLTAKNYAWVMSRIQDKQRELLPICLKHKLIEFSDGARFAGYGEAL